MNCEYCGAPITLEDEKCPHCGHTNEHAKIHARDMAHYKDEFEQTQSEVDETMVRYRGLTARLIVLFAAVVFTVAMLVIWTGEYRIYRDHVIRQTKADRENICRTADEYLENRDYVSFIAYADEHQLCSYKLNEDSSFAKYYCIQTAVQDYAYIYGEIVQLTVGDEDMLQRSAGQIQDYTDSLYEELNADEDDYIFSMGDAEFTKKIFSEVSESLDGLFIAYLNFTPEEAAEMHTMSDARRNVLLEDKLAEVIQSRLEESEAEEGSELDELRDSMTEIGETEITGGGQ